MFHPIDFETYPRRDIFYYFFDIAPTTYSITFDVDVTHLYNIIKSKNLKFFPAYLWLVTKNLNKQIEFKMAYSDETLGYFDTLTPLYATFHEDDKTFSFMCTEYNDSFGKFYSEYIKNQEKYGKNHGILANPQTPPPPNAYTVSCLPWVSFSHFSVSSENKKYFFPSVEAGKFRDEKNKKIMPLSLTCHHATTDGYHISKFIDDLNYDIEHFENYIEK